MYDREELESIIAGCKAGENEAFSRLVDIYASRCYGYFYRLCGNSTTSDELLSKLFVKLVEKIGSYKGGSFETWLFTTAGNLFRDHLRHQYRQNKLIKGKAKELESVRPMTKSQADLADTLQIQLEKLDAETAELLMLRFYGGFSFKELAEMRSEPIGTTLSKVHRGLKRLRELMENFDD